MSGSFPYDDRYDPPAPVVSLRVADPEGLRNVVVPALVDTGADATVIPEEVAEQLGLPVVAYAEISGVGGASEEVAIHAALVQLAGVEVMLRVAAFGDERIMGRDLLRRFLTRLDGPRRVVSFDATSRPSRRRARR